MSKTHDVVIRFKKLKDRDRFKLVCVKEKKTYEQFIIDSLK